MQKYLAAGLLASSLASSALAGGADAPADTHTKLWRASIGSGYAWSSKAGISNPDPSFWDASNSGYDDELGSQPFYMFGLSRQVHPYIDINANYTVYNTFQYQKHQEGTPTGTGPTGSHRNRFFQLDNRGLLFNALLHPQQNWLSWNHFTLTPFVGGGIGVGFNTVKNFYTVGYNASSGTGNTTSIGTGPTEKTSFAWDVMAGFTVGLGNNPFSVSFGYRYYDGGEFKGPSSVTLNTSGSAGTIYNGAAAWTGHLKTNQFFGSFNYSF